jgi:prolyl-tRNA editing enzyme YbaK/EbsC (Cys-tRNA(Pro) deacylase)
MWPEPVERIAQFLRDSEAHGRLEELPKGVDSPPGPRARAEAFECYGNAMVALVPEDSEIDRALLARRAGCGELRPVPDRPFPFQGAQVLVERSLLSLETVWLEAGSPRYVLGLAPSQLLRLTRAETGTFLACDMG